ncbi:MAG: ATP-binding protein [Rubrivivax sp.]
MTDLRPPAVPPAGTEPAGPSDASDATDGPGVPERRRASREVDRLRALYVQAPATLAGYALGMTVIAALFWRAAPTAHLLGWLAAGLMLWGLRLAHYLRFRRRRDAEEAMLLGWRRSWRALVLLQAATLGAAVWLFWGQGAPYVSLALVLVVYSFCVSSVQLLATQPRLFTAFIVLVLLPTVLRIASDSAQPGHWALAIVVTILFASTVLMVRTYGDALAQAITLKARTEGMAVQLREEKADADAARRAAEAANRAKTQFFAAASHDLRQPLHAMGLFAEALRQRARDPEVASLVNSINESVDALEGLFGELLDITRIDTGGVDVNPAPVRLRDVFARLRLHFEPVAFEKGLQLNFRGGQHIVQADPVLLERILRNLVSNAIRYTEDGGVLVGARRRGDAFVLQVWDSGIGISEANLARVFEEFFQVHGHRPLAAHDRKGLGLGLSIVKRLADLMGAPLTLRSQAGRGTVFSVALPPGRAARSMTDAAPPPARAPLGLTLQGRRFVVVEDEPAVREGLVVLLQSWGATVESHDSVEALQAVLDAAPANALPFDLALVDYRLPQGRTGVDALQALRARWPQRHLPAILVTGSTLGGHEDQAEQHDYHLLIKPVLPNKLRAMIAFKLGVR